MARTVRKGGRAVEDSQCPFCRIAGRTGEKAHIVCETDDCVAFLPTSPASRGHTLVIPRVHVRDVYEIDPELAGTVMRLAVRIAVAVRAAFQPEGVNLITSTGTVATQTVLHFHLHVVPRWSADGITIGWPRKRDWGEAGLAGLARTIADGLTSG